MRLAPLLGLFLGLPVALLPQEPEGDASAEERPGEAELVRRFAEQGVNLDLDRRLIQLDARICQRYEPLEYLVVVQPRGKDHESLLYCENVNAEALNAAMLLTGVQSGENGRLIPKDPPPTLEEMNAGVPGFTVDPAAGDGFYIYVAWERELPDGRVESYFYRAEDLILHARDERTYDRGRWVYLGSRFIRPHADAEEMFAAEAEGNLVSICYFNPANHLLTGADRDAQNQYDWFPNVFLIPELDHPVRVCFSREPLDAEPPTQRAASAE